MIIIDYLKNHPQAIPTLSNIWHEGIGKVWMPEISIDEIKSLYYQELTLDFPLTQIALDGDAPVGSCTLLLKEDFRPDLGPWISDLVVTPEYQKQGIGKKLLDVTLQKAQQFGFDKIYLFTFDSNATDYYQRLGWKEVGVAEFKNHLVTLMALVLT